MEVENDILGLKGCEQIRWLEAVERRRGRMESWDNGGKLNTVKPRNNGFKGINKYYMCRTNFHMAI